MGRMVTMDETYISKRNHQRNMKQIEPDKWFNPDFQSFINKEIVGAKLQT
jgi:hypothetical protein